MEFCPPSPQQLNVVALEDVFEDDKHVHIIMELAKGGELLHNLGKRHYSEGTVRDLAMDQRMSTSSQLVIAHHGVRS